GGRPSWHRVRRLARAARAGGNAQGDHHAPSSRGRRHHRATGHEGAAGGARFSTDRKHARSVCRPNPHRHRQTGKPHSRGRNRGAVTNAHSFVFDAQRRADSISQKCALTSARSSGESMRTKIEATWIVGHERGHHALIRDGELVFEGNKILHVGKAFDGKVDKVIDAKGKLVSPGFIDTHVHSGHRASHRLITDTGRPMYYGQPFLEISVPKEGKVVKGDP